MPVPCSANWGGHAYIGSDGSIAPYPGPIGSVVSPGLLGLEQFGHLAQASSLCGACKDACPVDIDLPRLLTRVRAGTTPHPNPFPPRGRWTQGEGVSLSSLSKVGLKAYGLIGSSPRLFSAAQKLGWIGAWIVSPFAEWMWIPSSTGWGYSRDFPRFASRPFRQRFKRGDAKGAKVFRKEEGAKEPIAPDVPKVDLVERFTEELTALGGKVYRVSRWELNDRLVEFLRERKVEAALIWDEVEGVDEVYLTRAGIRAVRSVDPSLQIGITGAASAIAETGTLVIASSNGQMLSASLLPEIHVAVLESSQIVETLEEALRSKDVHEAASAALISGPSRTADIEMTLTIGVHGPGEVHVFMIEDNLKDSDHIGKRSRSGR